MDHTTLLSTLLPTSSSPTTATAVTVRTVASATTTMVTAIGRGGSRNGTHRTVNVHGRLMYDEIVINDVWINAILSTMAFACAACLCVCFLYCKFQQWKRAAQVRRDEKNSRKLDNDSLPSYTIVTGLPTYEEAMERMKNPPNAPLPLRKSTSAIATAVAAAASAAAPAGTTATTMQVFVKDERRTATRTPSKIACCPVAITASSAATAAAFATATAMTPADPAKKFGLVSRTTVPGHDRGCSHCLSVQELLETYDVR